MSVAKPSAGGAELKRTADETFAFFDQHLKPEWK